MNDPKELIQAERMSKWPLYLGIAAIGAIFGVLVYSVEFSSNKSKDENVKPPIPVVSQEDKPLILSSEGMGIASLPTPPPTPKDPARDIPPIVVVQSPESQETQRAREELRRLKHQAAMSALSAPLMNRQVSKQTSQDTKEKTTTSAQADYRQSRSDKDSRLQTLMQGMGGGENKDSNLAADKDKEAFLSDRSRVDGQWLSPHVRMAGQPYEVKTGAVIPALMIAGINSDLPGQIIAQVAQNVYDTADGKYLLIPQGSRLYGVYDSRIIYGQSRVLVAWNRIIFPDGSSITLDSMPGADSAGNSGFSDEVNNHYWRIFGSALLMSLISGGASYAVDTVTPQNNGTSTSTTPTMQQEMATGLATQLGQTTSQMLAKNMNIKPTLEIRPGYRFNVIVTKDLVFSEPYSTWDN